MPAKNELRKWVLTVAAGAIISVVCGRVEAASGPATAPAATQPTAAMPPGPAAPAEPGPEQHSVAPPSASNTWQLGSTPGYSGPTGPSEGPLMMLLDEAGAGEALHDAGIDIYGHVEGSYTYNFDNPASRQNAYRLFDFEDNKALLNQVDLQVERRVNYVNATNWDLGFHVEMMYGADAGFIHSHGLFDYFAGPRKPENQPDLTQAYLDLVIPVGTGLRIRAGKFVNLVGYETIDPTAGGVIDFYSRSFIFGTGYPFTHTGVLATYDVLHNVTVTAGITRGDEQSIKDNNSAGAFLGSVNWVINKQWAIYVANSTGPEHAMDDSHYTSTWDGTLYYSPTNQLNFALNGYYLYDAIGGFTGGPGHLYDFSFQGAYQRNDYLVLKARTEWYHDPEGVRTFPNTDLYEVTLGTTIYPFPHDRIGRNLKIRPEIRYDWSDGDVFNGLKNQFTFGIDLVAKF